MKIEHIILVLIIVNFLATIGVAIVAWGIHTKHPADTAQQVASAVVANTEHALDSAVTEIKSHVTATVAAVEKKV
jgi:hypothetical protein